MTPIESYCPPEMLAQVYPEEFGHLLPPPPKPTSYTAEHLAGGCILYRLADHPYLHRHTSDEMLSSARGIRPTRTMQRLMSFRGYADRIGLNVSSISRA